MLAIPKASAAAPLRSKKVQAALPAKSRLMVLKDEWEALLARATELDERRKPLDERAIDLAPSMPKPAALLYRAEDADLNLSCGIMCTTTVGSPAFYNLNLVDHLRGTRQQTQAAQARAIEIVAAWDAHRALRDGVEMALGIPALDAEEKALDEKHERLRLEIMREVATTTDDLHFKCALALWCRADSIEEFDQEVQQAETADAETLCISIVRDLLMMEGGR